VSTEWIVLVCSIQYVAKVAIKKEFTYRLSDRQLDNIFEGSSAVSYENVYIRKSNLQKTLEITEI